MAKRFTDSTKYKNPFIRSLNKDYKLLWDYILHDCDHAGLWTVDFEIAQIYLGKDVVIDKDEAFELFNEKQNRVISIKGGEYWFIPAFIEFQYGEKFSKTNNIYKSIEKILNKYDLFKYLTVEITEEGETKSSLRNRISKKVKEKILLDNDLTCQYCSNVFSKSELVVDHIISIENGGDNEDNNLTASCVRCNSHKTDMDPEDFINKDYDFLKPTNKIKEAISFLKAPFNNLKRGKDKDKDKDMVKDKAKDSSYKIDDVFETKYWEKIKATHPKRQNKKKAKQKWEQLTSAGFEPEAIIKYYFDKFVREDDWRGENYTKAFHTGDINSEDLKDWLSHKEPEQEESQGLTMEDLEKSIERQRQFKAEKAKQLQEQEQGGINGFF